jgi:hypothetical protein
VAATTPRPPTAAGLPAWSVIALDGAIGSGVLSADAIEDLGVVQLHDLSARLIRSALATFDADEAVSASRQVRKRARQEVTA